MKKFIFCLFYLQMFTNAFAVQIHQLSVSPISTQAIKVSITTEAVELYYFQSWQYNIDGNVITLDVFYIPGFGSTIAYLNNNFEIPLDNEEPAYYTMLVRIYYINSTSNFKPDLQDELKVNFATPLTGITYLSKSVEAKNNIILYPNPTDGRLTVFGNFDKIMLFDNLGRTIMKANVMNGDIDLSDLEQGIYIIEIFTENIRIKKRVLLKK